MSSPRMWGCFYLGLLIERRLESLPHACGGVSMRIYRNDKMSMSSPRMWGCFCPPGAIPGAQRGLPHACGGVSKQFVIAFFTALSSPRMWGCFRRIHQAPQERQVFPTHVGVFLASQ